MSASGASASEGEEEWKEEGGYGEDAGVSDAGSDDAHGEHDDHEHGGEGEHYYDGDEHGGEGEHYYDGDDGSVSQAGGADGDYHYDDDAAGDGSVAEEGYYDEDGNWVAAGGHDGEDFGYAAYAESADDGISGSEGPLTGRDRAVSVVGGGSIATPLAAGQEHGDDVDADAQGPFKVETHEQKMAAMESEEQKRKAFLKAQDRKHARETKEKEKARLEAEKARAAARIKMDEPSTNFGEVILKRGVLYDWSPVMKQTGEGYMELVRGAQNKVYLRIRRLLIPNPSQQPIWIIVVWEKKVKKAAKKLEKFGVRQFCWEGLSGSLKGAFSQKKELYQELEMPGADEITGVFLAKPPDVKPASSGYSIHCWGGLEPYFYADETKAELGIAKDLVEKEAQRRARVISERETLKKPPDEAEVNEGAEHIIQWMGIKKRKLNFDDCFAVAEEVGLPTNQPLARVVFDAVDFLRTGELSVDDVGVFLTALRVSSVTHLKRMLPLDAFELIKRGTKDGAGLWTNFVGFKTALQLLEETNDPMAAGRARQAFDVAGGKSTGRLNVQQYLQAYLHCVDVPAMLEARRTPSMQIGLGYSIQDTKRMDRHRLLMELEREAKHRAQRVLMLVSKILRMHAPPPRRYPDAHPDHLVKEEQRAQRIRWMHKLLEREEMTKKKARDAAGAEDEEHELAGGVEVERSERRQVLRENKKVMAALRKREIQIELAAAGTDTINESKRGLEEVPHEIFRGPGSVERLGLAQIVDFSENELEYLPDQIVEDKQALIDGRYHEIVPLKKTKRDLTGAIGKMQGSYQMLFHMENVQRLDVSRNQLLVLPKAIRYLQALKVLRLQHNELRKLPQEIGTLQALVLLDVSFNRLSYLPDSICNMTSLTSLQVRGNQLMELPDPPLPEIDAKGMQARITRMGATVFKVHGLLAQRRAEREKLDALAAPRTGVTPPTPGGTPATPSLATVVSAVVSLRPTTNESKPPEAKSRKGSRSASRTSTRRRSRSRGGRGTAPKSPIRTVHEEHADAAIGEPSTGAEGDRSLEESAAAGEEIAADQREAKTSDSVAAAARPPSLGTAKPSSGGTEDGARDQTGSLEAKGSAGDITTGAAGAAAESKEVSGGDPQGGDARPATTDAQEGKAMSSEATAAASEPQQPGPSGKPPDGRKPSGGGVFAGLSGLAAKAKGAAQQAKQAVVNAADAAQVAAAERISTGQPGSRGAKVLKGLGTLATAARDAASAGAAVASAIAAEGSKTAKRKKRAKAEGDELLSEIYEIVGVEGKQGQKEDQEDTVEISELDIGAPMKENEDPRIDQAGMFLPSLIKLDLSNNRLKRVPMWLAGLTSLYSLNLAGNSIETLTTRLGGFKNVEQLDLRGNNFEQHGLLQDVREYQDEGDKDAGNVAVFPKLRSLAASRIGLVQLPRVIADSSSLLHVDLSFNMLPVLPDEIGKLPLLEHLNLSNNGLTELPLTIGWLSSLVILNIRGNKLKAVPEECGALGNLRMLDASFNKLESFPETLRFLSSLEELRVDHNYIPKLCDILRRLKELKKIEASHNRLVSLPRSSLPPHLTELHCQHNIINDIPSTVWGIAGSLKILDLSTNRIQIFPPEMHLMTKLTLLDVRYNLLDDIPLSIAPLLARPKPLDFRATGNPMKNIMSAGGFETGFWAGGVWRVRDQDVADGHVRMYVLEQAALRVATHEVWQRRGPVEHPRQFVEMVKRVFGRDWNPGMTGIVHHLHQHYRKRDKVPLPEPAPDAVNDALRAERHREEMGEEKMKRALPAAEWFKVHPKTPHVELGIWPQGARAYGDLHSEAVAREREEWERRRGSSASGAPRQRPHAPPAPPPSAADRPLSPSTADLNSEDGVWEDDDSSTTSSEDEHEIGHSARERARGGAGGQAAEPELPHRGWSRYHRFEPPPPTTWDFNSWAPDGPSKYAAADIVRHKKAVHKELAARVAERALEAIEAAKLDEAERRAAEREASRPDWA